MTLQSANTGITAAILSVLLPADRWAVSTGGAITVLVLAIPLLALSTSYLPRQDSIPIIVEIHNFGQLPTTIVDPVARCPVGHLNVVVMAVPAEIRCPTPGRRLMNPMVVD